MRQVTIMFRGQWVGMNPWHCGPKTVTIADHCPVCGGERGEPYPYRFYETGEWHTVHRWDNPCGHVDKYRDVYFEEGELVAEQRGER